MLVFILLGLLLAGSSAHPEPDLAACGGKDYGPHKNETDPYCEGYYLCLGGMRQSLSCAKSSDTVGLRMYYDPSRKHCTSTYKCPSLMDEATINKMCSGRGHEPQADKDDKSCKTYYVCTTNEMGRTTLSKFLCEDGTTFDPIAHSCSASYNDLCPTLKDINSADCVNKTKGPHADDQDPYCKRYYFCSSGNYKDTFSCEDSNGIPMFYDAQRMVCTSRYKCENQPTSPINQPYPEQHQMTHNNFNNPPRQLPTSPINQPYPEHHPMTHNNFNNPERQLPTSPINQHYPEQDPMSPKHFNPPRQLPTSPFNQPYPEQDPMTPKQFNNPPRQSPTSPINQPYPEEDPMTPKHFNPPRQLPTSPINQHYPEQDPLTPKNFNNPPRQLPTSPINQHYPEQDPMTPKNFNNPPRQLPTSPINQPYPEQHPMTHNNFNNPPRQSPTSPINQHYPEQDPMTPKHFNPPRQIPTSPINQPYPEHHPMTHNNYNNPQPNFSKSPPNLPFPQQHPRTHNKDNHPQQHSYNNLVGRTYEHTDDYSKHKIDVPNLNPLSHIPVIKLNKATTTSSRPLPQMKPTTSSPLSQNSRINSILNFDSFRNSERTNHPMPDFENAFDLKL